ncbi:MAG: hypothetical protein U1B30_15830 [Pseudomonadota bacterium]|nr:hypothetical protein [Pseudomonadota bacterium]
MKLYERLNALVGHDFLVGTVHDTEDTEVPPGRLQEAGEDYLIISTKPEDEGGFVEREGEWFILARDLTTLIHTLTDCAGCTVEAAGKRVKLK